jgi:Mg/Co/Ni transporter MgtE
MGRSPKKRKTLILIGIVCDDEIKDIIDLKATKDKTKMVKKKF